MAADKPQSRNEDILTAIINGDEYNKPPQSRIEELLLELKEAIEEGSGTDDYEDLENKPQINGHEVSGNQTGDDLGLMDQSASLTEEQKEALIALLA